MTDEKTESTEVTIRNEVTAGGQVLALVPQTVDQAWRLAQALARSGLAPPSMATAEKCLVAIMAGAEVGLPPFQAVQSFAVINNRPVLWGDGALAVVRSQGFRIREWIVAAGTGEDAAYCEVIRPDTHEVIERRFSVADAKQAKLWEKRGRNGEDTPWITYPQRMLQMRARSWALRDGAADVMRGFQVREEVEDYDVKDVTPVRATSGLRARLEANKKANDEGFNTERALEGIVEPIAKTERPEVVSVNVAATGGSPDQPYPPGDTIEITNPGMPYVPPEGEAATTWGPIRTIEALNPCEVCGAAAGVECAPSCSSWDELDPAGWPAEVTAFRNPQAIFGPDPNPVAASLDLQVRIDGYIKSMDEATTTIKLKTARARAHQLLVTLADTAPDRADALDGYFNRRYAELETAP